MPFNKPLLFKPTELGHITQFPTFDTRRAGLYTPKQMKKFWDNIIHASASDTVVKKLTRTILTHGNTVRISDPGNLEHFLSRDDSLLMDHLLTPYFLTSTSLKKTFGLLGYSIECLGNFFACFFLVKFNIDVVVIVLRGLGIRKVSGANFGFVRAMLGATFHLFVLSLQPPMYETDEDKNNGNLRMQNVTGNETLASPMDEENPTSLYPHVHIVNNPIPINSNITESQGNDPNVFHSSGNFPLNSIVSTHGNALSTSSAFWNNNLMEMLLIVLTTAMLRKLMEMLHYPHLKFLTLQKRNSKEKKQNALSKKFSHLFTRKVSFSIFLYSLL